MSPWFVTHSVPDVALEAPWQAWAPAVGLLGGACLATLRRHRGRFLDESATQALRGGAVLLLVLGHLSLKCLSPAGPAPNAGYWAVILFLLASGYGIHTRYGWSFEGRRFWWNRARRLYPQLWLTLALFAALDLWLLDLRHPLWELLFNLAGGHLNGALQRVNSPAWFVEYVVVLYGVYWAASQVPGSTARKAAALLIGCAGVHALVRFTPLNRIHSVWLPYTLVFPSGVLLSMARQRVLARLARVSLPVGVALAAGAVAAFLRWPGPDLLRPLPFVVAMVVLAHAWWKLGVRCLALEHLGKLSYGIYLVHLPLMVKYDFLLFRKPFGPYLAIYLLFITALAWAVEDLCRRGAKILPRVGGVLPRPVLSANPSGSSGARDDGAMPHL